MRLLINCWSFLDQVLVIEVLSVDDGGGGGDVARLEGRAEVPMPALGRTPGARMRALVEYVAEELYNAAERVTEPQRS